MAAYTTDSTASITLPPVWHVLTHLDMDRFKRWLDAENARRLGEGLYLFEPFFPYDFLSQRRSTTMDQRTRVNGREVTVRTAAVTHDDFRHMVFLRGSVNDIDGIVSGEWNKSFVIRLHYYRDATGKPATVPDREMQEFFDNCVRYRGYFEVCPPVSEIVSLDRVEILSGPFAGHEADVVRARHGSGGLQPELSVRIASGLLMVKMKDVRSSQVVRLGSDFTGRIPDDFIHRSQEKLLTVYEHRVKRVNDAGTRLDDVRKLNEVFHYVRYEVESRSALAHFRALMLICAHLRHDKAAEAQLQEEVLSLLAGLNGVSPSKVATDARAYLWVALYISTGDASYREAAKNYIKTSDPKSQKLRKFVRLMREGKRV